MKTVVPDQVAPRLEFEEFFRAEYPGLVRAFYVLTADQAEAEELAQEAMARAYERWDRVGAMDQVVSRGTDRNPFAAELCEDAFGYPEIANRVPCEVILASSRRDDYRLDGDVDDGQDPTGAASHPAKAIHSWNPRTRRNPAPIPACIDQQRVKRVHNVLVEGPPAAGGVLAPV